VAASSATNDNSCTVPVFERIGAAPGLGVENFRTSGYSGANADGGPIALARTREGYVEIIEMGTVTNASHQTLVLVQAKVERFRWYDTLERT